MFSPWNTRIKPHLVQRRPTIRAESFPRARRPQGVSPHPRLKEGGNALKEETGNPAGLLNRSRNQWFQVGAAPARECLT